MNIACLGQQTDINFRGSDDKEVYAGQMSYRSGEQLDIDPFVDGPDKRDTGLRNRGNLRDLRNSGAGESAYVDSIPDCV